MRRVGLFALALALLVAACGGGSTHSSSSTTSSSSTAPVAGRLSVSPAKPRQSSEVTLAFIAPATGGRRGASLLSFALTLAGPRHAGCLGARSAAVAHVVKGAVARVRLGGRWCVGSYSAAVEEFARPYCRPGLMCPEYVRLVGTVATAHFRVSAG
jgi:hypothetical protein